MIILEEAEVVGWEAAIRGMRNPMNSWEKSDSTVCAYSIYTPEHCIDCPHEKLCSCEEDDILTTTIIGPNDHSLMTKLCNAGTDHRKFMRMIVVYVDITAPLYWWKEFDTYKVGTVANSCSTMHKIHEKEFTLEDFSTEHLSDESINWLVNIISALNYYRYKYIDFDGEISGMKDESGSSKKYYWWQMIQLLPSSYNQKRTVMLNYEVLANIYKSRKNHKLDEWRELCKWIESLPYSELITAKSDKKLDFTLEDIDKLKTAIEMLHLHGYNYLGDDITKLITKPCGKKDLVEVTRCKNCEYYISVEDMAKSEDYKDYDNFLDADGFCRPGDHWVWEDDFCSNGKKKEEKE